MCTSAGNHDNNIYSQFFVESHYAIDEQIVKTQDSIKTANGKDSVVQKQKLFTQQICQQTWN